MLMYLVVFEWRSWPSCQAHSTSFRCENCWIQIVSSAHWQQL